MQIETIQIIHGEKFTMVVAYIKLKMVMTMVEKLIKSRKRVEDFAEVYTPSWLVKDMCNLIPQEIWDDIDKTFLEPACGNGNFLVEILNRKLNLCNTYQDGLRALKSITGIDIQADNVEETKERLLNIYQSKYSDGVETAKEILNKQIIHGDSLEIMERWYKEELMQDLETLLNALIDKVTIKPKPDKNGKMISVIEWHDDCSIGDYLKSALGILIQNKSDDRKVGI